MNHYEERISSILRKFAEERVDWTLNLFKEQFLGMSKQGKVYDFFLTQIENLKATNHHGNAKAYERTLHVMGKYDDKIEERLFPEIDIKYVNAFNGKSSVSCPLKPSDSAPLKHSTMPP